MAYHRNLDETSKVVTNLRLKNLEKRHFYQWFDEFESRLKTKIIAKRQDRRRMRMALNYLKLSVSLRKASKFAILWRHDYIKRCFINTLYNLVERKQEDSEKVMQMKSIMETRLKTQVVLSMRYFLLCQRS